MVLRLAAIYANINLVMHDVTIKSPLISRQKCIKNRFVCSCAAIEM